MVFWADEELGLPGQMGDGPGRSGSWVRDNFELPPGPVDERLVTAGEWALKSLQDYVDEATTEPWPGVGKPPSVHAAIRDRQLRRWFADGESTILECEPIDLTEATHKTCRAGAGSPTLRPGFSLAENSAVIDICSRSTDRNGRPLEHSHGTPTSTKAVVASGTASGDRLRRAYLCGKRMRNAMSLGQQLWTTGTAGGPLRFRVRCNRQRRPRARGRVLQVWPSSISDFCERADASRLWHLGVATRREQRRSGSTTRVVPSARVEQLRPVPSRRNGRR
jgi:hypothetical protein